MSQFRNKIFSFMNEIAVKHPACAKQNVEQDDSPRPVIKNITAMVVNIRGFHHWLNDNEDADIHKILGEYYQFVHKIVLDYNGTLDKLMADQMLFLFGVPMKDDNQTFMAWSAARLILNEVKNKYSNSLLFNGGVTIGISVGKSLVGNFGNNYRDTYTAIGGMIDDAFRLAKLGEPNTLCVTLGAIEKIDKEIVAVLHSTEECTDLGFKFIVIK